MKIRIGCVSNSSSSSFVVSKDDITARQADLIRAHIENQKAQDFPCGYSDAWSITEDADTIRGFTIIDNFSMIDHMAAIGVDVRKVVWDED